MNNKNIQKNVKKNIKMTTTSIIDEKKYKSLGITMGVSVRALSVFRQMLSNFLSIAGGRRQEIEKKLIEAREEAINELALNAQRLGADEVIGIHIEMSELSKGQNDGYMIVSATGTAVKLINNIKNTSGGGKNKINKINKINKKI